MLEEGLATTASGATGPYPYAYGLRYDVDLNSFTVSNVEVNPVLKESGKKLMRQQPTRLSPTDFWQLAMMAMLRPTYWRRNLPVRVTHKPL